jgi:hypothetical protein
MSSSHGAKCSLPAVQQRHISAADKTFLKSKFITGPHVIVTRGEVQPASCTAETYISRGQNISQTTFYYRTTCHRHTGRSAACQLYSRDIYQPLTKSILIAFLDRTTCGEKFSPPAVQQRRIPAADKTYFKLHFITGPHVIVTRDAVQPDSCTAETYISREGIIYQKQCLSAPCWKGRPAISL